MASDYQETTAPTDLDIARIVLHNEAAGLTKLAHALDGSFLKALDIMESAKGRVVISGVGKSGHIANKIEPTCLKFGGQTTASWSICRHMQRDRVVRIYQAMLRIEQSNLARRTLKGDLYRFFAKQCVDSLDIVLHII